MKFRFCGDGDCPDFVLAEISSTLSMMSSVKLKLLTRAIAQYIIDDTKSDIQFADKNIPKSAFACVRYLLASAIQQNVNGTVFGAELQQLGLPREHSIAICRTLDEYADKLRQTQIRSSLTVNELEESSACIAENAIDCVQLQLCIKNEIVDGVSQPTRHSFNIHKFQLSILLNELREARAIMERYKICDDMNVAAAE